MSCSTAAQHRSAACLAHIAIVASSICIAISPNLTSAAAIAPSSVAERQPLLLFDGRNAAAGQDRNTALPILPSPESSDARGGYSTREGEATMGETPRVKIHRNQSLHCLTLFDISSWGAPSAISESKWMTRSAFLSR